MEKIAAKSIISRAQSPAWFGVDYNMNIYRGCNHGCIYCDSRSACYGIERFDTVRAKRDALAIIDRELAAKQKKGVVATGSMSDPYNPYEKQEQLTRGALEILARRRFGVAIATKGTLIVRDIPLLQQIRAHAPVLCKLTITAADDALSQKVEPGAPPSCARFEALHALRQAGLYAGILLMPVLPFIEDNQENIGAIISLATQAGANFIYPAFGMTLRQGQREYYYAQLDARFPGLRGRYVRQFGAQYECASPRAKTLWQFFKKQCDAAGIAYRMDEIVRQYRSGYHAEQTALL